MSAEVKKSKRDCEKSSDFDVATQQLLDDADICQNQIDEIDRKVSLEILSVEKKYQNERYAWFRKREEFLSQIPNFWCTAIMNHPDLSTLFDDSEENCVLHHLKKIEVEEFEDVKSGYSIKFYFEENPYFENTILNKDFLLDFETPKSESTPIIWKEGCNHLQNPDTPRTSKKRRLEPGKNFFTWYADNVNPLGDDIAETIKDDLFVNPLQYYLVPDVDGDGDNGTDWDDQSSSSSGEETKEDENKSSTNK